MEPRQVSTAEDVRRLVAERELEHVKVGVFDADGVLRGKYMAASKLASSLDKGFGFCDVVLGWDVEDQLYDNTRYTGWHTGYPDAQVRLLPSSCRELPLEDGILVLGEFAGGAEAVCPRACLRRVLDRAEQAGFATRAGFEYEFFLFEETPHTLREKDFRDLRPMAPGYFGYSVLRNSTQAEFYQGLLSLCEQMDFGLEGLHEETGPGVLEAAIRVDDGLSAADKAALFKTFAKIYAQRHGLIATFMARWSTDWPGSGGHVHMSLLSADGDPVFHDPDQAGGVSELMRHFIGGQQRFMPELAAMFAPTVNSYRRLVPGFWAPTDATFGIDNRTCALRAIGGSPAAQRVEYRVPAADANPYLALAAAVASGLRGIEERIEPSGPVEGNAYQQRFARRLALPRSLDRAAERLRASKLARDAFGDEFVEHFAASRDWEARQFAAAVTDWEMRRYFEII